jgi:glycosyltransferase involved in cell wall biosynthesis
MPTLQPLVTVLLPCYNAERFLRATLESLVGQTYANLEILAIDDGSRDGTGAILAEYAARDARIRLEPNDGNRGLIHTLNRGVLLSHGELIARIDADDMAVPDRIESQVRFFAERPETQLLSTDVSYIGVHDQLLYNPAPHRFSARTLRFLMFFLNPLCHPTVMGRREIFAKYPYAADALHIEDYELWLRMVADGVVIRNLPRRLLRFRCNEGSVSSRHEAQQNELFLRFSAAAIKRYYGIAVDPDVHRILTNRMLHGTVRSSSLGAALALLRRMQREYVVRERLGRRDAALIARFIDRHALNVAFHGYKRSAAEESARALAARELVWMALRNPVPACQLAAHKGRARLSR